MVKTRPAQTSDASRLFVLVGQFATPTPPDEAVFSDCFRSKLSDPASCIALAERDQLLVGYLSGYCHPAFYASGKAAWVDEVLVTSMFRGQGIGRMLVRAFEQWAQEQGCVLVSLATAGSRGSYERLGYTSKAAYYKKYLLK
jgi:GNAT superfamily N-acetyltransferase